MESKLLARRAISFMFLLVAAWVAACLAGLEEEK